MVTSPRRAGPPCARSGRNSGGASRVGLVLLAAAALLGVALLAANRDALPGGKPVGTAGVTGSPGVTGSARQVLDTLAVKGRAPRTGYRRANFGPAWADVDHNGCDTRNDLLARDLTAETFRVGTQDCVVLTGLLRDPYTGRSLRFVKADAGAVQIDHVVSLSNAWQTGAQALSAAQRLALANDPLNLLAVDGPTNQAKSDGDAATWLPPSRAAWCPMVARQIAVKARYGLWVTSAERDAMVRVLGGCPGQAVPVALGQPRVNVG